MAREASAGVRVMELNAVTYRRHYGPMLSHINVGAGNDCTTRELAQTIACVTGFERRLVFDASKPDGASRKLLDVSRLKAFGCQPWIGLGDDYGIPIGGTSIKVGLWQLMTGGR